MSVQYFNSNGFQLAYSVKNNHLKNSLLLLHGFNDTKDTFLFLEDYLSTYFNLYKLDFRGHGDSDWKKDGFYQSNESLSDIHNFITHILPEGEFFILAHSMGAGLTARYTGLFPERIKALFLLEGFSGLQPHSVDRERIRNFLDQQTKKVGKEKKELKKKMSLEEATTKLGFIYSQLEKSKVEKLIHGLVKQTDQDIYTWKNDPSLKISSPIPFPSELSRHLWSKILCPILLIYGKESHLIPKHLEEILSHFKKLEYFEIEGAGHNMHHDKPEEVLKLIDEFLKKNQLL